MRYQLSASPEAPPRKASDEVLILRLARGPARKASDEVPILQFARGPAPRGLGRTLSYRLARGRLGINPITAALTNFPDRMSHPTNVSNHSRNISRLSMKYSGMTDGTGVTSAPCSPGQDGAGVTDRCARHYAHDGHPYGAILPDPNCSEDSMAWGVKFGSL